MHNAFASDQIRSDIHLMGKISVADIEIKHELDSEDNTPPAVPKMNHSLLTVAEDETRDRSEES